MSWASISHVGRSWDSSIRGVSVSNPGRVKSNLSNHINTVCRASFMQLRHVRYIKATLICDSLEKVTHAFIGLHQNYCNALLYGLSQSSISKLQCIQNVPARLLMGTTKFNPITPALKSLHRLPVEKRIDFKMLLLVYCALHD